MSRNSELLDHNNGEYDEKLIEMGACAMEQIDKLHEEGLISDETHSYLRFLIINATPGELVTYKAPNSAIKKYCSACGCELSDYFTTKEMKIVHCILCGKRVKGEPVKTKRKYMKVKGSNSKS